MNKVSKVSERRQYPLRIAPDQYQRLQEIAARERRSVNFIIGEAIEQYISQYVDRHHVSSPT